MGLSFAAWQRKTRRGLWDAGIDFLTEVLRLYLNYAIVIVSCPDVGIQCAQLRGPVSRYHGRCSHQCRDQQARKAVGRRVHPARHPPMACGGKAKRLRGQLDACYTRLYGFTRDEMRYTPFGVDPKEVHGEDPHLHSICQTNRAGASVDTPSHSAALRGCCAVSRCSCGRTSFSGEHAEDKQWYSISCNP